MISKYSVFDKSNLGHAYMYLHTHTHIYIHNVYSPSFYAHCRKLKLPTEIYDFLEYKQILSVI